MMRKVPLNTVAQRAIFGNSGHRATLRKGACPA